MQHGSTRIIGIAMACFLLGIIASGGCGHSTFEFPTDEANMQSGSGGGSPAPVGSGGLAPAGSGGFPFFPGSGGAFGGSAGQGGQGGQPPCLEPGCVDKPCCSEITLECRPFEACGYCSHPDQCPLGSTCDPLTDQCLAACDDDFDCPDHARLCDESRGVCTSCYEDIHCTGKGRTCVQGFCVGCDDRC